MDTQQPIVYKSQLQLRNVKEHLKNLRSVQRTIWQDLMRMKPDIAVLDENGRTQTFNEWINFCRNANESDRESIGLSILTVILLF